MVAAPKIALVAEDEILIRMVAVESLAEAGFEVLEAEHAERALAILRERAGRVHLLFTDIHMPGPMSGLELARQVRGLWPHIALLIASDLCKPPAEELPAGSVFLSKPYDSERVVAHARCISFLLRQQDDPDVPRPPC
jgi:two-component system, response regulator PdtaR